MLTTTGQMARLLSSIVCELLSQRSIWAGRSANGGARSAGLGISSMYTNGSVHDKGTGPGIEAGIGFPGT